MSDNYYPYSESGNYQYDPHTGRHEPLDDNGPIEPDRDVFGSGCPKVFCRRCDRWRARTHTHFHNCHVCGKEFT
jgi:hypothetical protein